MHILDAIISMHIWDALIFMHILDVVIFMHTLESCYIHAYARYCNIHARIGERVVIFMHIPDAVIFMHILESCCIRAYTRCYDIHAYIRELLYSCILLSVLWAVFSLRYVQSLACVMSSLQARTSSPRSEHAPWAQVNSPTRAQGQKLSPPPPTPSYPCNPRFLRCTNRFCTCVYILE